MILVHFLREVMPYARKIARFCDVEKILDHFESCTLVAFESQQPVGTLRHDLLSDGLRGCLGTHFRNSLKIGRLDKVNPLF